MEGPVHREWSHLWRKEYRIETSDGVFIVLNRLKSRLNFRGLRELGIEFAPVHLYQSVLNFSFPARAHSLSNQSRVYRVFVTKLPDFGYI